MTHTFALIGAGLAGAILVASALDMADGIHTSRVLGEKLQSRLLRKTVEKVTDYWRILVLALLADMVASLLPSYNLPYMAMLIALSVVLIEGYSMIEHARKRQSRAGDIPGTLGKVGKMYDELKRRV